MVDLPVPDSPVSHRIIGLWPLSRLRAALCTSTACQCTFCERRKANCSMPAPTVRLLIRSMTIKLPMSRFWV
ncbi:hypothetical protein D3C75_1042180 [compost metagenome]